MYTDRRTLVQGLKWNAERVEAISGLFAEGGREVGRCILQALVVAKPISCYTAAINKLPTVGRSNYIQDNPKISVSKITNVHNSAPLVTRQITVIYTG